MATTQKQKLRRTDARRTTPVATLPGQVVLVLQGGGALGAYQAGVYQALREAGIEPDWVIGTSIGAINAALIAGNPPLQRLHRLQEFWHRIAQTAAVGVSAWGGPAVGAVLGTSMANLATIASGIPAFFAPNPLVWLGPQACVGTGQAAFYKTDALRHTLEALVDVDALNAGPVRMVLGAVKVQTGEMRYFDNRQEPLSLDHILASAALPPAFPAVRVHGDFYWDGGLYSNTPIEAVLEDKPRRDSLIFAVDLWSAQGPLPESLWQVQGREKDIRYASRSDSHIARQQQLHHLRHVIQELAKALPEQTRATPAVKRLAAWGCSTTMHIVRMLAPDAASADPLVDMDFRPEHIRARWQSGYADAQAVIDRAPWSQPSDPLQGIVIYDAPSAAL